MHFLSTRSIYQRPSTRLAVIIGAFLLVLGCAQDASANCAGGATSRTVTPGENLATIVSGSTEPCTLSVSAGTYDVPSGVIIADGIAVRAVGAVTLRASASASFAVAIGPNGSTCPSGATLEGFTLEGGRWGVLVDGAGAPGCPSNQISGVTLRGLAIHRGAEGGHGIDFKGVQNSVIDSCTIFSAYANGIFLENGSNNNLVMNNTVLSTTTQHGMAIQSSSDNVIVGNTIGGAAFDGILVNAGSAGSGSLRNRIERNVISGHSLDGITLTDASSFNYIGLNTAISSSYHPVSKPNPSPISGVGIWVNGGSNGTYLFGNDLSGSPENGIDVLTSRSTLIQGNRVHANLQGGIWVANVQFAAGPEAPVPQDTVIQGNNIFFNTHNAQVNLEGVRNVEVFYNYLSGADSATLAGNGTGGIHIRESTRGGVGSDGVSVFENIVTDVSNRAFVFGSTTNSSFFRNRFLNGSNDPNAPGGRHGLTYSIQPASVQWQGGAFLGGNHWSEFTAAAGNPDPAHPYTAFIGNTGAGPYVDWYPYQSEALVTAYAPYSVDTLEPIGGSVLAAGTKKTVRWVARGCVLVDLYYVSGAGAGSIATRQPNTGHYFWNVPGVAVRNDYSIQVVCLNSAGAPVGVSGFSRPFTIANSDLALLNPGRAFRAANGGTVRVAWKKSASVGVVNIFIKSSSGAEIPVASNISGTFHDIILPAAVWNSGQVTIRIADASNSSRQDSVDGYFMVRGSPAFMPDSLRSSLVAGSIQVLAWSGAATSLTVDLDLYQDNVLVRSIARNLADFGTYTWFVPYMLSLNSKILATFKDANGAVVGQADSGLFRILDRKRAAGDFDGDGRTDLTIYRPSDGGWYIKRSTQNFSNAGAAFFQWGLSTDIPLKADFDGDGISDLVVYRPSEGGWYVRYSSLGYNPATWAYYQWGLPGDTPIAADFDGDARTDLAIYRPSDGGWYIRFSSLGYSSTQWAYYQWGLSSDLPLAADFDGDGRTDLAIYRPSDGGWYIRHSSTGYALNQWVYLQWGLSTDKPLVADFDGDGRTDLAIYRPSDGGWYIRYSSRGYALNQWAYFQWGTASDKPVTADFDGDGKTDIAIFRSSDGGWYVRFSSLNYASNQWAYYQWGLSTDVLLRP
jgi:parallel beta-helix repeat protein